MVKIFKKLINNDRYQSFLETVAKTLFLIYSMLGFSSIIYGNKIVSYVMWPTFFLCALLVFWRVLKFKKYYKTPGVILAVLFVGSHLISSVININYGLKDNIVLAIYLVIFFFLFYAYPLTKDSSEAKKEFHFFALFFVVYALIGSIMSIYMLIKGMSSVSYVGSDNYEVVSGFIWGRLWGVFLEPSRAGLIMLVAAVLLVYFFVSTKNVINRVLCSISIIPLFIYIVFSDSRTTYVSIFFAVLSGLTVYCFSKKIKKLSYIAKNIFVCLLVSAVAMYSPIFVQNVYNSSVKYLKENSKTNTEEISSNNEAENTQEVTESEEASGSEAVTPDIETTESDTATDDVDIAEEETTKTDRLTDLAEIERNYDMSDDISNRRFDLWKDGLKMISKKPFFGYSYNGIRPYALENIPDSYLVSNGAIMFSNFHNEVINVFAAQGIFGFGIFLLLIAVILITFFKNIKYISDKNRLLVSVLFSVVVTLTCGAMFNSAMFYSFTPSVPFFWLALGYMIYLLKNTQKSLETDGTVSE